MGIKRLRISPLHQKEIMSEINDIEEIPEGIFSIKLKLIQKYQRLEPSITAKYKDSTYHKGSFRGGSIIDLNLITCKDKINITTSTKRTLLVRIIFIFIYYASFCPLISLDQL